ncbi:hypothetical protein VTI74DRAFT_11515 [Chaetomium olivicolor]
MGSHEVLAAAFSTSSRPSAGCEVLLPISLPQCHDADEAEADSRPGPQGRTSGQTPMRYRLKSTKLLFASQLCFCLLHSEVIPWPSRLAIPSTTFVFSPHGSRK